MNSSLFRTLFVAVAVMVATAPFSAFAAQGAACSATSPCTVAGQSCNTAAGHCTSTTNQQCGTGHAACTDGFSCAASNFCFPSDQTATTNTDPFNTNTNTNSTGGFANPLKAGSLPELLNIVLHAIVQIGSILLVLALVWVGFLFVAAQGAEEKIRDARNALLWTVVGGLILLGAEAISAVISATVEAI